jgi:hypothetical protein
MSDRAHDGQKGLSYTSASDLSGAIIWTTSFYTYTNSSDRRTVKLRRVGDAYNAYGNHKFAVVLHRGQTTVSYRGNGRNGERMLHLQRDGIRTSKTVAAYDDPNPAGRMIDAKRQTGLLWTMFTIPTTADLLRRLFGWQQRSIGTRQSAGDISDVDANNMNRHHTYDTLGHLLSIGG